MLGNGFGNIEFTCGDVHIGNSGLLSVEIDACQEVVAFVFQHGRIGHGTGGNDTHHIAFDQAFGGGGILHLFTDGNLVSFADQLFNLGIDRVERDAAHRCALFEPAVFSGQCQLQLAGGGFFILLKKLVKVAQPE